MAFSKALIVDDSKLARVTLKKKLEAFGLQVIAADGASDAYELLNVEQPDIVFMDHLMPEVDGFEATINLRQNGFTTPIIMCTGKEHDGYLAEALAVGANYILGKPPSDEDLANVLAMQFDTAPLSYSRVKNDAAEDANAVMTVDDFDLDELDQVLADMEDDIPVLLTEEVQPRIAVEELLAPAPLFDEADDEELDDWMQSLLDDDVDTATDLDQVEVIASAVVEDIEDDESSYFLDEVESFEEVVASTTVDKADLGLNTDWLEESTDKPAAVMIEAAALEGLVNARVLESQAVVLAEMEAMLTPLQQQLEQQLAQHQLALQQLAEQQNKEPEFNSHVGIDKQEVEMLVQAGIDASRNTLMQEVGQEIRRLQSQLDSTPIEVAAEHDERELLIRLEEVLHPRLIELKASLLADVHNKMQADKESGFDELLDLRLNALLAERMASFEARIRELEEKQSNLVPANDGIPVVDDAQAKERYRLSEKVSRHLEQLIEENAQFAKRIEQIRQMSLLAGAAGAAGLLIATLQFLLG